MKSGFRLILALLLVGTLAACGGNRSSGTGSIDAPERLVSAEQDGDTVAGGSILDLFRKAPEQPEINVNRYIWSAALDVLNFLPVQSVDPFTGVFVTGFGTPPGGGTAYRATVKVSDPALDARSLNLALQTRGGRTVSKATQRAVEDAILSRARELRIADSRF